MPKLKEHLFPRIRSILLEEEASDPEAHRSRAGLTSINHVNGSDHHERNSVFIQNDRIYRHHLARFNYTTYDVRRAQDVINPGTSHRDIILLANRNGETRRESDHPFLCARVLGIYHANVVYTGEGMLDYKARRMEFLWVRWFEYDGVTSMRWEDLRLDSVHFPSLAAEGAFGFVDPRDVLRGCHIIPAFSKGRRHTDEVSISRIAHEGKDWIRYHVNRCVRPWMFTPVLTLALRFVDRDMLMRYHWGLAVGHIYSYGQRANIPTNSTTAQAFGSTTDADSGDEADPEAHDLIDDSNAENRELGFDNNEDDWIDESGEDDDGPVGAEDDDDDVIVAMNDMYGFFEPGES